MEASTSGLRLTDLPSELIENIFTLLSPCDLACLAQSCRQLRIRSHDDHIWRLLVNRNLQHPISSPRPAKSFRELYIAHHPHWFLVKQQIWFSDSDPSGKLIVARYLAESASIVAYTIVAVRGLHTLTHWEKDTSVLIHSFNPTVSIDTNVAVLKLNHDSTRINAPEEEKSDDLIESRYSKEILMDNFNEPGIFSSFVLSRSLPSEAIFGGSKVWPPLRIPSTSRTRNASNTSYSSSGHRPTRLSEVSESTFRVRRWAEYSTRETSSRRGGGLRHVLGNALGFHGSPLASAGLSNPLYREMRRPEEVTTYATLPYERWQPTPQKPWQGIWCGDYSGHGCEFLVILQPDADEELPLPEGMDWLLEWFAGGRRRSSDSETSFVSAEEEQEDDLQPNQGSAAGTSEMLQGFIEIPYRRTVQEVTDIDDAPPSGRLEAIKLTGDINVPRAEYTFIAPDIGHGGFIRVADEESFRGARIVRSAGHIAGRGFQHDQFTPSQLIMISHDRLAQFWEGFGHISYFQRVDVNALRERVSGLDA